MRTNQEKVLDPTKIQNRGKPQYVQMEKITNRRKRKRTIKRNDR